MIDITFDIESNDLLNNRSIDYTRSPYKLRDSFVIHSIVVEEHQTGDILAFYNGDKYIFDGREYEEKIEGVTYHLKNYEPIDYKHFQLKEFVDYIKNTEIHKVVAHNQINFDLLALKLYFGMDYEVEPDTWCDKKVVIEDTMVTAKTLNPDRFGGASLDNLAKLAGKAQKVAFRKYIKQEDRFKHFAADMLYYNIFDTKSNTDVYHYLEKEKGTWDWKPAIQLEKAVAEIITRQEHRGFKFDKNLAEECVKELDDLMEERRQRVEPLLPMRPATKKFLKEHTPPVSQLNKVEIKLPKTPFLKNGEFSATMVKFADKYNAELELSSPCKGTIKIEGDVFNVKSEAVIKTEYKLSSYMQNFVEKHGGDVHPSNTKVRLYGEVYELPLAVEPIKTEMVATIDDTAHIKNWLVGLGWKPTEYKSKDITVKSGPAKLKRTKEELDKAIDTYVEETLVSNFKDDRMLHMGVKNSNVITFKRKLVEKASRYGCKVLTNPSFTVGQEKEIDPALLQIAEDFPYVTDIVEYLTYKHRRNSILGGGLDWEEGEEAEKGYLASYREDGRIPTPADSCGAATSRFKHRVVTNIPRVTSLYGKKMRELFGVGEGYVQVGYDFDSLEAIIESHYCWKYDETKEYCNSLTLPKPLDVHTKMAEAISNIIGKKFERSPAKSVKYGCTYGAQEAKVAQTVGSDLATGKMIFDAFWQAALPLKKLKDVLVLQWKDNGKKYIIGIDGRKVPTRAEHAILNSLFQSAGVICAKFTMVVHDRLLKKAGLLVDFFKDDWETLNYCQQMIAYHDESQIEETQENFQWKSFNTEEEANLFRKSQDKPWSEPFEKKGKWFVGYSEGAGLISKAVDKTTEHFKLNVPLSAGYIIGKNWGDCH